MAGDQFIKFEGGKVEVKGESTAKEHDDWCDIDSFSWGASQQGTFGTGTGGAGAGKVSIHDVTISKIVDRATPNFFKAITLGSHFDKATIEARKPGGDEQIVYYKIELEKAYVTSLNNAGAGGNISESLSLNFRKMTLTYYPQADEGSQEGAVIAEYDFAEQG